MIVNSEVETVAEAVDRLGREGYMADFRPAPGGLKAANSPTVFAPEQFAVHQILRFEGPSSPDDEAIVFALEDPTGSRGTYVAAYGPAMSPAEAEMAQRLTVK